MEKKEIYNFIEKNGQLPKGVEPSEIEWGELAENYELDENFIAEYEKYFKYHWYSIAKNQDLSLEFIMQYKDKLPLLALELNFNISEYKKEKLEKIYKY